MRNIGKADIIGPATGIEKPNASERIIIVLDRRVVQMYTDNC
jgi:hypothetical protein